MSAKVQHPSQMVYVVDHDDQEDVSLESKKENLAAAFNMDRVEIKAAGLSGNPLNRRDEVWWW